MQLLFIRWQRGERNKNQAGSQSFHQRVLLRCLLLACFSFYHRSDIQRPASCLLAMLFRHWGALHISCRLCWVPLLMKLSKLCNQTWQEVLIHGGLGVFLSTELPRAPVRVSSGSVLTADTIGHANIPSALICWYFLSHTASALIKDYILLLTCSSLGKVTNWASDLSFPLLATCVTLSIMLWLDHKTLIDARFVLPRRVPGQRKGCCPAVFIHTLH